MKNYIDIEKIPELAALKDELIETVINDTMHFFENIPDEQKIKYDKIQSADFLKSYSLQIKHNEKMQVCCGGKKTDLFNFIVNESEHNCNNGNGPRAEEINSLLGVTADHCELPLFCKMQHLIPEKLSAAWLVFYKTDACVTEDQGYDQDLILVNILLEDLSHGDFEVTVKDEKKTLNKKGDYCIFNGALPHKTHFTGGEGAFLVFVINGSEISID